MTARARTTTTTTTTMTTTGRNRDGVQRREEADLAVVQK
jgi:hypothetical protein